MSERDASDSALRQIRDELVAVLSNGTWNDIEDKFSVVKLKWRKDLEPGRGKPRYVNRVLRELDERSILGLSRRCLSALPTEEVIGLQDAVWLFDAKGERAITEITRLALAEALEGRRLDPEKDFSSFLLHSTGHSSPEFEYSGDGVARRDPFDLLTGSPPTPSSMREALAAADFLAWPDERVRSVVETLVRPEVRRGAEQSEWVALLNDVMSPDGFVLEERERISGHPVFALRRRAGGVGGRPKNLVFASNGPKPEIGFSDAISNDIVILKHAESCLIYDDPFEDDGLLWDDLGRWYARKVDEPEEAAARRKLGERLRASLQSEPERRLFSEYFRQCRPKLGDRLPALVPQVYLHYDPRSLAELMGEERFLVQRMDFLLLLPHRVRVVLEVDGKQHYSEHGKPSTTRYAETMQGDRDLRLAGYDVFRFGGGELQPHNAVGTVGTFFTRLFRRYLGP